MACVVELHPDIADINEWLHSDVGYGAINELLEQRAKEQVPHTTLSRHREKCLGLEKKAVVRAPAPQRELKAPPPILPLPSDQELLDEAKRVIFHQMKTNPTKVPLNTLATIIAASMREKKEKPRTFEEIIEQLGRDTPIEAGPSVEEGPDSGSEPSDP